MVKEKVQNNYQYSNEDENLGNKRGSSPISRIKDPFKRILLSLIEQIEDIYKLNAPVSADTGIKVKDLGIRELNEYMMSVVKNLSAVVRKDRNIQVAGVMASFLYISEILVLKDNLKVSFIDHPGLHQLSLALTSIVGDGESSLAKKTKVDFLYNKKISVYLTHILLSLEKYEEGQGLRKSYQLNYRLLRVLYLLILYGNRLDSVIIATFCSNQVKLSLYDKNKNLYESYKNNVKHCNRDNTKRKERKSYYKDKFDYNISVDNLGQKPNNYSTEDNYTSTNNYTPKDTYTHTSSYDRYSRRNQNNNTNSGSTNSNVNRRYRKPKE